MAIDLTRTIGRTNLPYATDIKDLNFIECKRQPLYVTEAYKFAKNCYGQSNYFLNVARNMVRDCYNIRVDVSTTETAVTDGANRGIVRTRLHEEVRENRLFYYGLQNDNLMAWSANNLSISVPGQDLKKYINHMDGVQTSMVKPIKKGINTTILDSSSVEKKKGFLTLCHMIIDNRDLFKEMQAQGVMIRNPFADIIPNIVDIEIEDIKDIEDAWRDEYEIEAETLINNLYQFYDMEECFLRQSKTNLIDGVSTIILEDDGLYYKPVQVNAIQALVDIDANDQYGRDMMRWGYVDYLTYDDVCALVPDMDEAMKADIYNLCYDTSPETAETLKYLQTGFDNIDWINKDNHRIAVVKSWFIAPRNKRYKEHETRFGDKYVYTINDAEKYKSKYLNEYNPDGVLGANIRGDFDEWDIHKSMMILNKYVFNYGYERIVYRTMQAKWKPEPNAIQFIHDRSQAMFRSPAGRLKWNQIEKDRLKKKIVQLTAKDKGRNLMVYADELTDGLKGLIEDFDAQGIALKLSAKADHNPQGNNNQMNTVSEVVDLSLSNSVLAYLQLIQAEKAEMSDIAGISSVQLGQDSQTMGKAVREGRIEASNVGLSSQYEAFGKFCTISLQRFFDYNKLCLPEIKNEENLFISKRGENLFAFTKELSTAQITLHVESVTDTDPEEKKGVIMMAGALAQQSQYLTEQGISPLDPFKLLKAPNTGIAIQELDRKVRKAQKRFAAQQAAQAQAEQDNAAQANQMPVLIQSIKEENANYRAMLDAKTQILTDQNANIMQALELIMAQQSPTNNQQSEAPTQ